MGSFNDYVSMSKHMHGVLEELMFIENGPVEVKTVGIFKAVDLMQCTSEK